MNIREALREKGATDAQLNSKCVAMVEEAMCEHEDIISDTARYEITRLRVAMESAEKKLDTTVKHAEQLEAGIEGRVEAARKVIQQAETTAIKDPRLCDAVKAFQACLTAVRDIFGDENMTEDVMRRAIKTSGYVAWGGIVGPKDSDPFKNARKV